MTVVVGHQGRAVRACDEQWMLAQPENKDGDYDDGDDDDGWLVDGGNKL